MQNNPEGTKGGAQPIRREFPIKIVTFVAFAIVAVTLAGLIVMFLWNRLMPSLFGIPLIGFGQAVGLLVLSRILFGGLRAHGRGRRWGWRRRMMERWAQMTPEERERFRQGMHGRCGPFGAPAEPKP
jgi:hypothetical protein